MHNQNRLKNTNKLMALALPLSMNLLVNMIPCFVAILMLAKLGKIQLAAGALAITTYTPIMMAVSTIFYAVGILISHSRGQNKTLSEIGSIVRNGFWLATLLAMIASGTLWHMDKLLILFKQNPHLIALTKDYFYFAGLSIIPTLFLVVISQFFSGTGNPKFTLFTSVLSLPINILLTYGFVFGQFGLPQLALGGISCATFIVQSLFCSGILLYMLCKNKIRQYKIFSGNLRPNWSICRRIFTLGYPIGLQFGGELGAMAVSTYFLGYFGIIALAAGQIVSQYAMLVVVISLGLSQALSLLVGEAYGNHNGNLIKQYINSAMLILTVFFTSVLILFLALPHYLINLFMTPNDIGNPVIIHLAICFFIITALTLFVDGIRNLLSAGLRGLQDSKTPMNIGIYCLWLISLPISYIIAFYGNGGPIGLRIGFMSGFIIAAFLLWRKIQAKLIATFSTEKTEILPTMIKSAD
ncbi:MATE family efflux transporter [Rickettsiella endosymbiont of Dermanyssus gallinae]|uniref:MATE family efflux transporter n=1 Tax=Rickettsiella endosymbiont of Dermanyssus gallinae TaxID=2856608 RepID=UPI001C529E3A|nr:MATE family efflux transporter [Rickettsiella endosymbiont of Dermanyssus gallinae]